MAPDIKLDNFNSRLSKTSKLKYQMLSVFGEFSAMHEEVWFLLDKAHNLVKRNQQSTVKK